MAKKSAIENNKRKMRLVKQFAGRRARTRARANTRRAPGEWVCEVMDERQRVLVTQRFFIVPDPNAATATTDE